jgi:hypothetical protein
MIDTYFVLAAAALGLGLSLSTYRLFARRMGWPMGALHAELPFIPVLIGIFSLLVGFLFAAARGTDLGGWYIVAAGILLAVSWTALLRVGSQVSLFLAPIAAGVLVLGYLGFPLPGNFDITPPARQLQPQTRSDWPALPTFRADRRTHGN